MTNAGVGGELPDSGERGRKVLVTGGAGFIGSHLTEGYLERGDEVWVVDDLSSGKRENLPASVRFEEMSIEDPRIRELFRDVRFDLVSHHAAQVDVRISVSDPARDAHTNVLGLLNILEGARAAGTERIVFASSGGVVYGEPELRPTPETVDKLPLSPYGVTKLAGEYYLQYYRRVHGLNAISLRYSNVYGPRQDAHGEAGVVAILSGKLLAGETLTIFGDGEQTRDYVFVGDVVRANLKISEGPLPEGVGLDAFAYNVGTGVGTTVNELADMLEAASGLRSERRWDPPRAGELRHSSLDTSRLRAMGWRPQVALVDGLKETFEWCAAQRATATGGSR